MTPEERAKEITDIAEVCNDLDEVEESALAHIRAAVAEARAAVFVEVLDRFDATYHNHEFRDFLKSHGGSNDT